MPRRRQGAYLTESAPNIRCRGTHGSGEATTTPQCRPARVAPLNDLILGPSKCRAGLQPSRARPWPCRQVPVSNPAVEASGSTDAGAGAGAGASTGAGAGVGAGAGAGSGGFGAGFFFFVPGSMPSGFSHVVSLRPLCQKYGSPPVSGVISSHPSFSFLVFGIAGHTRQSPAPTLADDDVRSLEQHLVREAEAFVSHDQC